MRSASQRFADFAMDSSGKSGTPQWSKWHIALAVGIGTPVALGIAYWYYTKQKKKPPTKETASKSEQGTNPTEVKKTTAKQAENGDLINPEDPYEKAKTLKNQGNKFYKEGSFTKAVDCYTNAIEICPPEKKNDIATFYQNRAAAYEVLKNYSQVISDCTKSLELNQEYAKALQRRAKAYETTDDLQKCLEDMTTLCILEGFQNQNSLQMTDRVLKKLSRSQAKEIFQNRPPCLPSKHYTRHYFISFSEDPIMKSVEEYRKHMPERDPAELSGFRLVIHKLAEESYDEVIPNCNVEIERQGQDTAEALLVRATFKLLQGQLEDSQGDLNRLLAMESVDVKVRVNALIKMGALKVQFEEMDEALTYFNKATELDLNNADIYLHRGQVALLMDHVNEALKDMEKSTLLNPNFPCAIAQKCFIQYRCGLQFNDETQKTQAMKGFEEVTRKFPECSESCFLYAQILNECGEFEKAEKYFLKAGELDPKDPNVFVHRGLLLFQWKQDMEGCIKLLNQAIEMDEKCHFGLEALGSLEVQRGNLQRGLELFQRAVNIANTESEIAHLLSLLKAAEAQAKAAEKLGVPLGEFGQPSGS